MNFKLYIITLNKNYNNKNHFNGKILQKIITKNIKTFYINTKMKW